MKIGSHQRRGEGRARSDVVELDDLGSADARTSWRPSTRWGRRARGSSAARRCKLTNLDKVLFPAKGRTAAITKRDLDPLQRHHRPGDAAVPRRSTGQPAPLPRRHRQAGLLAQGGARRTRPTGCGAGTTSDADPGETEEYLVLDSPAALAWAANYGAIELHPWTSTTRAPAPADVGDDRHRSGRRRAPSTTFSCSPACTAPRSSTSASRRCRRSPASAASRSGSRSPTGYTFDDTRAWVERLSRLIGDTVPDLVSWEWEVAKRGGRARLDYTQNADQQDAGRAVQHAARARRTGVGPDHVGRARRSRSPARSLDHSHRRQIASPRRATRWHR